MSITSKKSERGVALLFSLGILGLMTVLALAFATFSLDNQNAAQATTNAMTARELAATIPDRVMYRFSNPAASTHAPYLNQQYSRGNVASPSFDWIWKMRINDLSLQAAIYSMDTLNYTNALSNPTWQYIKTPTTSPEKIVGRFAYVAIASGQPLLDIGSFSSTFSSDSHVRRGTTIKKELNPQNLLKNAPVNGANTLDLNSVNSLLKDGSGFHKDSEGNDIFTAHRNGLSVYDNYEQFISTTRSKDFTKAFVKSFAPPLKHPEIFRIQTEEPPKAYHRQSLKTLAEGLQTADATARRNFVESLAAGSGSIKEASANPLLDEADVKAITWNNIKIPWFSYIPSTPSATEATDVTNKRKQIIANFIDFFIPNTVEPTSDQDASNWFTSTPKYIGLKKTPYISGIGLILTITPTVNRVPTTPTDNKYTLEIKTDYSPIVEIINPWANLDSDVRIEMQGNLRIKGSISYAGNKFSFETGTADNLNTSATQPGFSKDTTINSNQRIYTNLATPGEDLTSTAEHAPLYTWTVQDASTNEVITTNPTQTLPENVVLEITEIVFSPKVRLAWRRKNASDFVYSDFSQLDNFVCTPTTPPTSLSINLNADLNLPAEQGSIENLFFVRAKDPRHNLTSDEWFSKTEVALGHVSKTFIALLNDSDLSWSIPKEEGDDSKKIYSEEYPTDIGTVGYNTVAIADYPFYVRNKADFDSVTEPFSPWELSFIHRAAPWETLNFTKYDKTKPTIASYTDGDLGLLDQLKLTEEVFSYDKINVNELDQDNAWILKELLKNTIATTKGIPPVTTAPTDDAFQGKDNLIAGFFQKMKEESPYYFASRIEPVVKELDVQDGTTTNSDGTETPNIQKATLFSRLDDPFKKEELISKTIMLLDAEPTYLPRRIYILGVAQTIQETNASVVIRNIGSTSNQQSYASGYRTSLNGIVITPDLHLSPETGTSIARINATLGTYDNVADIITGTQKIFAVLERDYTTIPYTANHRPVWRLIKVDYVD